MSAASGAASAAGGGAGASCWCSGAGAAAAGAAGSSDDPQPQSIAQAAIDRNARIVFMRKLQHIDPSLARQCVANAP